jgi:D-glycero-D-manno-heptose 1,7-bisphosphate phosphatase
MNRAVFFDRDGIINKVIYRENKPCSPRKIIEFKLMPEITRILNELRKYEFKIIIFTNQPDISRGLMKIEDLEKMHKIIKEVLYPDRILYCPHDDKDNCDCRKPKPGMIVKAAKKLNINLNKSFVVGDTWKDMEAGKAAGCITILLDAAYNQGVNSDYKVKSLDEAVEIIKLSTKDG